MREKNMLESQNGTEASDSLVAIFGAINIGLAGASKLVDNLGPILHDLLTAGQCAVAVVTVIYVWRKAQEIKRKAKVKIIEHKKKKTKPKY